jgi:hypothetical protein
MPRVHVPMVRCSRRELEEDVQPADIRGRKGNVKQ